MIGLLQRVSEARVEVNNAVVGQIDQGILLLLGVEREDTQAKCERLCERILNYRIFNDADGKMNLNLKQVGGGLLVVSQFTLVADTRKGNRPGFSQGASPELGEAMYQHFIETAKNSGLNIQTGQFGADMQVHGCNDGPVTFQLQV